MHSEVWSSEEEGTNRESVGISREKGPFFASSSARCTYPWKTLKKREAEQSFGLPSYHHSFDALINHAINHKTCRPLQSQFLIKVRSTINQNCFCNMSHFSAGLFVLIQTAFQIFDLRLDDDGFFSKQYIFFLITSWLHLAQQAQQGLHPYCTNNDAGAFFSLKITKNIKNTFCPISSQSNPILRMKAVLFCILVGKSI